MNRKKKCNSCYKNPIIGSNNNIMIIPIMLFIIATLYLNFTVSHKISDFRILFKEIQRFQINTVY